LGTSTLEMLNGGYAFDVQMPLIPLDPNFRSFKSNVLPVADERGIAVLGMKSMGVLANSSRKALSPLPSPLLRHKPSCCHNHQKHNKVRPGSWPQPAWLSVICGTSRLSVRGL